MQALQNARSRGGAVILRWMALVSCLFGFSLLSFTAHAASNGYFVATNGSDSNAGTQDQPFRTIQKCASVATSGMTCYIKTGIYHETVTPANSGTATAPIIFRPWHDDHVEIDGADAVTGWSLATGKVYQTTVQTNPNLFANQVFVDGVMVNDARWPNTSLDQMHPVRAIAGSGSNNGTLYDGELTQQAGFWVGATIHFWGHDQYGAQTATISSSVPGELTFTGFTGCPYLCVNMYSKYYITGLKTLLDHAGEWFYDSGSQQLSLWTPQGDDPSRHTVEVKQRNYAFDLSGKSFVQVQGIHLFASTINTDDNSQNDVIDRITARYLSQFETIPNVDNSYFGFLNGHVEDTGIILRGSNNVLSNSDIGLSAGNGVLLRGNNNTVTNNLIHDVDYAGTYGAGVNASGNNQQITHNTIYQTGRDAITVDPPSGAAVFQHNTIAYNDIFNFSTLNRDSGAIYLCCQLDDTGTTIDHNLVHDSQVTVQGANSDYNAVGIYPDNGTADLLIHHNVLWNTVSDAFHVNPQNGTSANNLYYNNTVGGGQNSSFGDCCGPNYTGSQLINNIFSQGIPTSQPGATLSNNIYTGTDPQFANAAANDYHLQASSPAIDAGKVIPGVTDGYVGSAPDIGAYEYGGTDWTAGSTLDTGIIPIPSILSDTASAGQIVFSWGAVKGAIGYKVHYGTSSGVYDHTLDVGNALSATLKNLKGATPYYFAVSAYGAHGRQTSISSEHWDVLPSQAYKAIDSIYASSYSQASSGITNDKEQIGNLAGGQWVAYNNVDFGKGVNSFTADISLDSHYAGQTLELHLDSLTGPLIGSLVTQGTGDDYLAWNMVLPESTLITPTSGVHTLYLLSTASSGNSTGNIASFHFTNLPTRDAYSTIQAASFDQVSGDIVSSCTGSTCTLGHLDNGGWADYENVDFGTGATGFTIDLGVPASNAAQKLELHLDSPTGPLIATLTTQSTGDWNTFTQQSTTVSGASGAHNLYLVVPAGEWGVGNISWFTFTH